MREGIFISYARADGEAAARALHARLAAEAPDLVAWLDRFELEGGIGWWKQVEAALDRAEFLVLVLTPAAVASENTRREWRSARQRGVCVYPVLPEAGDAALAFDTLPRWMQEAHRYDLGREWPKLVAHLRRGCQATRVPFMAPPLPPRLVRRGTECEALVEALLASAAPGPRAPVVLRGPGGFGKTTLAAVVCHDERIVEGYHDGILWTTLGQTPNRLHEIAKLYAALTGERPGFVDEEDAARELALKLESRQCLIVIDDAWRAADVRRFLLGGAACGHLVTTRLPEMAPGARSVEVGALTPDEAAQMLASRSEAPGLDAARVRKLIERLGMWPLAIKLVGSVIRQRLQRGEPAAKALDYVAKALDRKGITAFDAADATDRGDAVARSIAASLDLLDAPARVRCLELAVFPEDKAIPLAALAHLWQCDELDAEDLARRLDDLALVDLDLRLGSLRLHDTLRAYFGSCLAEPAALHARLLEAWGDAHALPYPEAWRGYAYHLLHAGRAERLRALLLDPAWLRAKLRATDIHAVIADFDAIEAEGDLALLRDALRLAAPALAANPDEWPAQLHGRLLGSEAPALAAFRILAGQGGGRPWLRLLHATLDPPGGMLRMTLSAHARAVVALAADEAHRVLVSGSADGSAKAWDWATGIVAQTLPTRALGVTALALDAGGTRLLSGGADGLVEVWDLERHERVGRLAADERRGIRALALSADAQVAVAATRAAEPLVWQVEPPRVLHTLRGHAESVTSVAISADGALVVSGSDDGSVRAWSTATGSQVHAFAGHAGSVTAVALRPDGGVSLSGGADGQLRLWDHATATSRLALRAHGASVSAVALAAAAPRALSGASDGSLVLWDLDTGRALATLGGHSDAIRAVTLDSQGRRAASASADRSVKLWQLDRPAPSTRPPVHAGAVVALVFSPDGRLCASGGTDGRVVVQEVATGRVLRTIDAHAAPLRSLAFTPDSACVLSGSIDDRYWLSIVETGERSFVPVSHAAPVDHAGFSARARYLASCALGGTLHLWDVPSGVGVASYATRRLFDHLIEPAPRRSAAADLDALDHYLPGEAVYEVGLVRMDRDGRHVWLSATRREPERFGGTPAERREEASADRACVLAFEIATAGVRSMTAPQAALVTAFEGDASGTRLLWAAADHSLALWDLDADAPLARCRGHVAKVNAVALGAEAGVAWSCSSDRSLRAWRLDDGAPVASLTFDAGLRTLAASPVDGSVAVGDFAGRVHFVRLEPG